MRTFVIALIASLAAATPSFALRAQNGMFVEPTGPDTFLVRFGAKYDDWEYWCAAGDYVIRKRYPQGTRVYRLSPPPRKRGEGIEFTLDPAKAVYPGLAIISPDNGLSAPAAQSLCSVI
jgi:hypothetical protein